MQKRYSEERIIKQRPPKLDRSLSGSVLPCKAAIGSVTRVKYTASGVCLPRAVRRRLVL